MHFLCISHAPVNNFHIQHAMNFIENERIPDLIHIFFRIGLAQVVQFPEIDGFLYTYIYLIVALYYLYILCQWKLKIIIIIYLGINVYI